ncbi:MAG: hypothetical protein Q7T81_03200 [Pseudolabrys sp.]|nr:hypothetical protein [Pseudolabrys sp.]
MQKLKMALAAGLAAAVVVTSIGIDSAEARSRRDRNNAAAAAAVIGTVGAIAAIAAADSRRDRYYDDGYRYRGYRGDGYRNRAYRSGAYYNSGPRYYRHNPAYPNAGVTQPWESR